MFWWLFVLLMQLQSACWLAWARRGRGERSQLGDELGRAAPATHVVVQRHAAATHAAGNTVLEKLSSMTWSEPHV